MSNPFISEPPKLPVEEAMEPDAAWGDALSLAGPPTPQAAPPAETGGFLDWPRSRISARPLVCVMGLHGGAGASTLTRLIGEGAFDVERQWPVASGWERPLPRMAVVAIARSSEPGLLAAQRLARLWADQRLNDADLLGIVISDDGPKLSKGQQSAMRGIGRMTPHGWHLPWHEPWRTSSPPLEDAPVRVRRIIKQIRALSLKQKGTK